MKVAMYEFSLNLNVIDVYAIYIFKLLAVTGVKYRHIRARVQYVHTVNIRKSIFK